MELSARRANNCSIRANLREIFIKIQETKSNVPLLIPIFSQMRAMSDMGKAVITLQPFEKPQLRQL